MIELKKIEKSYNIGQETFPILKGLDLTIQEGEFVAIMGPSGSGKSTLMNIMGCLDRKYEGQYLFQNTETSQLNDNQVTDLRNLKIGFIFQNFNLLPKLTAYQNIALPLSYQKVKSKKHKERVLAQLEKFDLLERRNFKPKELSGGQQQRIAIARALVNHPQFILADEPTGALDSENSHKFMELLTKLHEEHKTIVVITHEAEVAEYCQRIITIRDGLIINDTQNKR